MTQSIKHRGARLLVGAALLVGAYYGMPWVADYVLRRMGVRNT